MDAKRFDTLARALTGARSRRSALGAVVAGGVLSALGFGREETIRAAQGQSDLCVLAGPGGTCVLAFEAIVRQGPSASQPLVAGGTPGALRGYLSFSLSGNGSMEDADLLLDDGSSLPIAGLAIGHGFQARIDLGQGQALVAVGVGEQDITRCLGRLDGTVTGTEVGDLGEWHATAGVQNIPSGAGGGTQTGGSGTPPVSGSSGTESQPISGSAPTEGSAGSTTGEGSGNTPASEPAANRPVSKLSDSGSQPSEGNEEPGESGGSAPSSGGGNRPADKTSDNPPASASTESSASTELRQESTGSGDELACPEGETRCGNTCVNLQTDDNNCGECGLPCASELSAGACIGGICACSPGTTRCDDICVNTDRDPLNCGQCGNACSDARECLDGACAPDATACPEGQTLCDDACVTLQTDVNNCGACGIGCAGGEECAGGTCATAAEIGCPEGQLLCGDMCRTGVAIPSGGIVCSGGGAPPTACPPGQALCNGACISGDCQPAAECPPGQGLCYGLCRDFQNDPGYCGGCSTGCTGGAYCAAGTCVYCSSNLTPCGNDCVDTRTDLDNCGACGNRCGTQCIDGQCTAVGPSPLATCPAGQSRCGDTCVDLATDNANCGSCGNACASPTHCAPTGTGDRPGVCFIPKEVCIAQGMNTCGSYCADYANDPNNCGGCYFVCGAGYACGNGQCYVPPGSSSPQTLAPNESEPEPELESDSNAAEPQLEQVPAQFACPDGQVNCGGYCADMASDPFNCGACGIACGAGSSCDAGVCGAAPAPEDPAPSDLEPEPESVLEPESDPTDFESEP